MGWDWSFVETLLKNNADPDVRNDAGQTPFMKAALLPKYELLEKVLTHCQYNLKNKKGRQFVREVLTNDSVKQTTKDFITEAQALQKAARKPKSDRKKSHKEPKE